MVSGGRLQAKSSIQAGINVAGSGSAQCRQAQDRRADDG